MWVWRARARREGALAQLCDDPHVVAVGHARRQRGTEHEGVEAADREQVLDQEDERRELRLERRECRQLHAWENA